MPLFGGGEELPAAKSTLETLLKIGLPGVFGAAAIAVGLYGLRSSARKRDQQRQKLYQDIEKIPAEQRPAVLQLLQDLREGTPRGSSTPGYHIDHLLGKYS